MHNYTNSQLIQCATSIFDKLNNCDNAYQKYVSPIPFLPPSFETTISIKILTFLKKNLENNSFPDIIFAPKVIN